MTKTIRSGAALAVRRRTLLAAGLEVLADVDGVETEDVTVDGRAAVKVKFTPWWFDFVASQSFVIDKETAQVLSVRDSDPGGTYSSTTTLSEVLPRLPEQVRATFDQHGDGERVYDAGVTPIE